MGSGGRKTSSGVPGGRFGGQSSPSLKGHSILRIYGCQTMHIFVYLDKLQESLVKHDL